MTSSPFIIRLSGLKEGQHEFKFKVEPSFFEQNKFIDEVSGKLNLKVLLDKKLNLATLDFEFDGTLILLCDRCNSEMNYPLNYTDKLYIKFGHESYENTDEVIVLHDGDHEMDITSYIYEFIQLAIPMKKVHQEGDCDEEVINKLKEFQLNKEKENKQDSTNIDPRWEALNKLKSK
jgi:uncharacterized metal-binding protein YceD (DUF177 family)